MNWELVLTSTAIATVLSTVVAGWFARPKQKSEARKFDTDADLAVTDLNVRHAREEADRAQAAREEAERSRNACRQSLVRSLDLSDVILDAFERMIAVLRAGRLPTPDEIDEIVSETIVPTRRTVRELRP
ncbi:hypothetical protein SEA_PHRAPPUCCINO_37 [Mycobacterium phage Phrappuccino]|uniref:Uncharacterized protein n=1 Tax=Mycobacterium phage Phrappuccino TaxID=2591223 RepID=A0A514DDM6_9CAUD|nr:hypothetical protein KHQ87_gp037 [Mycobacterium phage Phrappuccino]QDH91715.1 hypothetical protein SEA_PHRAPPUCCINO_37 [Mycobacterium phage Phrappuccino]QIQ63158.1 hypothetical protein SEA_SETTECANDELA_37 [Mycobacterium phage Settecandela]